MKAYFKANINFKKYLLGHITWFWCIFNIFNSFSVGKPHENRVAPSKPFYLFGFIQYKVFMGNPKHNPFVSSIQYLRVVLFGMASEEEQ